MTRRFSKTKVIAGLQCEKHLYLRVHHPELAVSTESPATITGKVVEAHARDCFPDAVLIERDNPESDPFQTTQVLVTNPATTTIFEAAIQDEDLKLFVDVLTREQNGWVLTEIKAGTSVKNKHINDVSIQAVALKRAGIPVKRFELMHINKNFVYLGDHNYDGLFVREDITERILAHMPFIESQLNRFTTIINGPQPERHIGSHCKNPYPCSFYAYCRKHDAEYPVADLPNAARVIELMMARDIYDIRDIPVDVLNSETHLWIRKVTIAGKPEIRPGAIDILNALAYPRYYLDFECIQFAIPVWPDTQPYTQLPFQWSCHIQRDSNALLHREFLDTSGYDPRRAFAEALIEVCEEEGPVLVYNQTFEKGVINGLASIFPDLSKCLRQLNMRIVDLYPIVKQHYYHPDMNGSWSIKAVLPCLAPELNYASLRNVHDGIEAQAAYFQLIDGNVTEAQKVLIREDLLEYCKLDTLAMVKIVENLGKDQ